MQIEHFDPAERALQKAHSRQQDELDIASGQASIAEVQARNGFIPGDIARAAKIISWGPGDDL